MRACCLGVCKTEQESHVSHLCQISHIFLCLKLHRVSEEAGHQADGLPSDESTN